MARVEAAMQMQPKSIAGSTTRKMANDCATSWTASHKHPHHHVEIEQRVIAIERGLDPAGKVLDVARLRSRTNIYNCQVCNKVGVDWGAWAESTNHDSSRTCATSKRARARCQAWTGVTT